MTSQFNSIQTDFTHAGHSTVVQGLLAGLPMLLIPRSLETLLTAMAAKHAAVDLAKRATGATGATGATVPTVPTVPNAPGKADQTGIDIDVIGHTTVQVLNPPPNEDPSTTEQTVTQWLQSRINLHVQNLSGTVTSSATGAAAGAEGVNREHR